jgi:uncharacterized protein (TIRG00374 family)
MNQGSSNRGKAVRILLIALAIGGLLWALGRENLSEIYHAVTSAKRGLVLLAVGLYFFEVAFWACRWKVALKATGYDVGLGSLYVMSHAGMFFTNITPTSKTGGEPFRAYFAKKHHGVPYSVGFASIIGEGILSIPPYLLLLLAGLALKMGASSPLMTVGVLGAAACFFGGLTLLGYKFVEKRMGRKLIPKIVKRLTGRKGELQVVRSLRRFYKNASLVLKDRRRAFLISTIALLLNLMSVCRVWIILLALGVHSSFVVPLLAVTVPMMAGIIPLLPGGLVAVEATMTAVLLWCGLPLPLAISATLIERGISYVLSTLAGALAASYLGLRSWGGPPARARKAWR